MDRETTEADATRTPVAAEEVRRDEVVRVEDAERPQALFEIDESRSYESRWKEIQVRFVDQPRESVQHAHALVGELMQRLTQTFANERSNLESQWDRGDEVSTEDLRVALRRYRSFFERLLSA